jgi:hypothetical protein
MTNLIEQATDCNDGDRAACEEYRVAPPTVMTNTLKDVLPLTADLTTAELAEALAGLRFQNGSSIETR